MFSFIAISTLYMWIFFIDIRERCDLINHCDDNSDEFYCDKIRIDEQSYDKYMAPVDKFDEGGKRRVYINVTDLLIEEINFVQSEFLVRFTLHMHWRDERLTFLNLHNVHKNLIPLHEISK